MTSDQLLNELLAESGMRTLTALSTALHMRASTLTQVRRLRGRFNPSTAAKLVQRFPEYEDHILACTRRGHSDCRPDGCPWYRRCQELASAGAPVECEVVEC